MLCPSHKICSMCRSKLYAMEKVSSSTLHPFDSIPQENTTDTGAESSTELPEEGHGVKWTARCSDECVGGSRVAEASKDITDPSESSSSDATELHKYVGAAWNEASLESTESSISDGGELGGEFIPLNEGLTSFGISPISRRRERGAHMVRRKSRKL